AFWLDRTRTGDSAVSSRGFYQQRNCSAHEDQPEYSEGIYPAGDGEDECLYPVGNYWQDCWTESLNSALVAAFDGTNEIGLMHMGTCRSGELRQGVGCATKAGHPRPAQRG